MFFSETHRKSILTMVSVCHAPGVSICQDTQSSMCPDMCPADCMCCTGGFRQHAAHHDDQSFVFPIFEKNNWSLLSNHAARAHAYNAQGWDATRVIKNGIKQFKKRLATVRTVRLDNTSCGCSRGLLRVRDCAGITLGPEYCNMRWHQSRVLSLADGVQLVPGRRSLSTCVAHRLILKHRDDVIMASLPVVGADVADSIPL